MFLRVATSNPTLAWRFRRWLGGTREEAKHTKRSSTAVMSPPSRASRKEIGSDATAFQTRPSFGQNRRTLEYITSTTTRKPPRTSAHPLRLLLGPVAEGRPRCHQSPAALEQVGSIVGGDRLIA